MSRSVAAFVLIRDGKRRCYEDEWAQLYRELMWGSEDLEEWLTEGEESEYEPEELSGGVIVDFDSNELVWGENETLAVPRVRATHERLLEQAWPGFKISFVSEDDLYAAVRGSTDEAETMEDDDDCYSNRPETVREAAGLYDDEDEEQDEEDDEEFDDDDGFEDDSPRAWLTIIDEQGAVRQRMLEQVSDDLLRGEESTIQDLCNLKAAEVPPEKGVREGIWINLKEKQIGFWGGAQAKHDLKKLQQSWESWTVTWAKKGYADQCAVSDVPGMPMSDTEAIVQFIPQVLSAKRFDMGHVLGTVGGQLKKTAMKATGCLTFVLCLPLLAFGYFAGNMKAAGIAIGVLVALVVIVFKVIEFKLKSKLKKSLFGDRDEPDDRSPVAGPLDETERRNRVDQLLSACGFPSVEELTPPLPKEPTLDDLM